MEKMNSKTVYATLYYFFNGKDPYSSTLKVKNKGEE